MRSFITNHPSSQVTPQVHRYHGNLYCVYSPTANTKIWRFTHCWVSWVKCWISIYLLDRHQLDRSNVSWTHRWFGNTGWSLVWYPTSLLPTQITSTFFYSPGLHFQVVKKTFFKSRNPSIRLRQTRRKKKYTFITSHSHIPTHVYFKTPGARHESLKITPHVHDEADYSVIFMWLRHRHRLRLDPDSDSVPDHHH